MLDPQKDRIIQANRAASSMLGYAPEDMHSLPVSAVHPDEMPKLLGFFHKIRTEGHGWTSDLTCTTKNGVKLDAEISASVVDIQGKPHMLAMIRDVSERKEADHRLRESEEKYKDLFQSAFDVVFMLDESGNILDINKRAEQITGYSTEELGTFNIYRDLVVREDRGEIRKIIRKLTQGAEILFNVRWQTKNGEVIDFEGASTARRTPSGKFISTRCTLRDITVRRKAEHRIKNQIQRLQALRSIDIAISGSLDIRVALSVVLEQVLVHLHVDAANVLLLNAHSQTLSYVAGRGFETTALQNTNLRFGEGHAGRAAMDREIVHIPDLSEDLGDLGRSPFIQQEGFVAYFGVPLISKAQVIGVLEIFHRTALTPDKEWIDFLEAMATQAAIAMDSAQLYEDLQRSNTELTVAYDTTLEGWARTLELRDKETEGHTRRVTEQTIRLARHMGLGEQDLVHIRRGSLLHDIGKIGIPDKILLKPGSLTDDEWKIMRSHPVFAHELLKQFPFLRPALAIPYYHHEKWDGTGYPRGIRDEEIPIAARIFAVVDCYDALTSDRPYRSAWSPEKAISYIRSKAGSHFDPQIVDQFLSMLNEAKPTSKNPRP